MGASDWLSHHVEEIVRQFGVALYPHVILSLIRHREVFLRLHLILETPDSDGRVVRFERYFSRFPIGQHPLEFRQIAVAGDFRSFQDFDYCSVGHRIGKDGFQSRMQQLRVVGQNESNSFHSSFFLSEPLKDILLADVHVGCFFFCKYPFHSLQHLQPS